MKQVFYLTKDGDDFWSGTHSTPQQGGKDGPFGTLYGAFEALQKLFHTGRLHEAELRLAGGVYRQKQPLKLINHHSGRLTIAPMEGENVTFSGGVVVTDWTETTLNSTPCWKAHLPMVQGGMWDFNQIYVNETFRPRSRFPKEGSFHIKSTPVGLTGGLFDNSSCFEVFSGEIDHIQDITAAEAVIVHYWAEERMPIVRYEGGMVYSDRKSIFNLQDDFVPRYARYWLENVKEAFSEPGEWYLDKQAGDLFYIPRTGETMENTAVEVPVTDKILVMDGVNGVTFSGIDFACTDWKHTEHFPDRLAHMHFEGERFAGSPQAASFIDSAIELTNCTYCTIEQSTMKNLGYYALDIGQGCEFVSVDSCHVYENCAGGLRITGTDAYQKDNHARFNRITNCHVHDNTKVFYSAVGIAVFDSYGNYVGNNKVHDMEYSGISCGWVWGYNESNSHHNIIENNLIYNLGTGLMSDMGGIYLLGSQPGTEVRGNTIHSVTKWNYGGWGIYLDEGSSYVIVEDNIVYDTASEAFYQHFGMENTVRRNQFSSQGDSVVRMFRIPRCSSVNFYHNEIKITKEGQVAYFINEGDKLTSKSAYVNDNMIEMQGGSDSAFCLLTGSPEHPQRLATWQALGYDTSSRFIKQE